MKTITLKEYHAALRKQGTKDKSKLLLICPMCGTMQCANDLILAGAGKTFEEVVEYLGFSCVGRFTNAGPPREKPDGRPCNWTLGGLIQAHKLEVIMHDGERYPTFEVATPEQARAHWGNGESKQ